MVSNIDELIIYDIWKKKKKINNTVILFFLKQYNDQCKYENDTFLRTWLMCFKLDFSFTKHSYSKCHWLGNGMVIITIIFNSV